MNKHEYIARLEALQADTKYRQLQKEYHTYSIAKICGISEYLSLKYFGDAPIEIQLDVSYNIDGPLIADLRANRNQYYEGPKDIDTTGKWYFITLTTDQMDAPAYKQLLSALLAIVTSKIYQVDKYYATWEFTEAGRPHIHVLMRITKDTPKVRDLKKFNLGKSVDMKKQDPKQIPATLQYMKKQHNHEELNQFLEKFHEPKYRGSWHGNEDIEDDQERRVLPGDPM